MPKLPKSKYPVTFHTHKASIPAPLLPWLVAGGSLTAQFEAVAGQPLRVQPVFEGFQPLGTFSSQDLQLPRPQMAWVRDVALYGNDDTPWATAQSIFPSSTLTGSARRLRYLGSTPLGYVLFGRHKPTCQRVVSHVQVAGSTCYTRKNFYCWHGQHILVQETFLPAFLKRLANN